MFGWSRKRQQPAPVASPSRKAAKAAELAMGYVGPRAVLPGADLYQHVATQIRQAKVPHKVMTPAEFIFDWIKSDYVYSLRLQIIYKADKRHEWRKWAPDQLAVAAYTQMSATGILPAGLEYCVNDLADVAELIDSWDGVMPEGEALTGRYGRA